MPYVNTSDAVHTLFLGAEGAELDETNPENRFKIDWLDTVDAQLDQIIDSAPAALVITATGSTSPMGSTSTTSVRTPTSCPPISIASMRCTPAC